MEKKIMDELKSQFNSLCHTFPTPSMEVNLVLRDAQSYGMTNDSFTTDHFDEGVCSMTIVLFYHADNPLSETDHLTMRHQGVSKEHLPFWYLFHEYGHVHAVSSHLERRGIEAVLRYLEETKKLTDDLLLTDASPLFYKETFFEKDADLFAKKVYMHTVKELDTFFRK